MTNGNKEDLVLLHEVRLGDTIQNIDISILNSRYLESIPIFKIEYAASIP